MLQKTVSKIHFEDFGGFGFERLVFAYVARLKNWSSLEWRGQTGKDKGRDIWGLHEGETFCYQCANYKSLTVKKATTDIDKLINNGFKPNNFILVCGGSISNKDRDIVINHAHSKGIPKAATWSGVEFEERLRNETPELISRFVQGEPFPNDPKDLIAFSKKSLTDTDNDIVDSLLTNLKRPAFTTSFRNEVSLPNFDKAIEDTILLLNTGVHRLRDGTIVNKLSSRHKLKDKGLHDSMEKLTQQITDMRDTYYQLKRLGDIKDCDCGLHDCSVRFISEKAIKVMDQRRQDIFDTANIISPDLNIRFD